jgi:hydroxymethylbilane synthase
MPCFRPGNSGLPCLQEQKSLQTYVGLRLCIQGRRRTNHQFLILRMQRLQGFQLFKLWSLMKTTLRVGSRGSKLALWQAQWVQAALSRLNPGITTELVIIKTKGDKILDVPLAKVGGKGLFVKEIEEALLDGRIDIAVHSMKDMPADIPDGLTIGAVPQRADARDAFISLDYNTPTDLPTNAKVGTSSLRRSAQLLHLRPDIHIRPLRGNLNTRLNKLKDSELDAVILAAAGLQRLDLADRIRTMLPMQEMLPAVGQGALCIESRAQDDALMPLLSALNHGETHMAIQAERSFLARLEGGCQVPIAAYAVCKEENLQITGLVAELDGSRIIKSDLCGPRREAQSLGLRLAEKLIAQGADDILVRLQQYDD